MTTARAATDNYRTSRRFIVAALIGTWVTLPVSAAIAAATGHVGIALALVGGAMLEHTLLVAVLALFDIADNSERLVDEAEVQRALLQQMAKRPAA